MVLPCPSAYQHLLIAFYDEGPGSGSIPSALNGM